MANIAERLPERMTGEAFERWMETWSDLDKWELHDGYPVAMTGGTQLHDTISNNIGYALRVLRERGCREHRDTLLRGAANSEFRAFPDFYVRCGPSTDDRTWIDDPVAVFEVLSRSTWRKDQGYKRDEYFKIPTLRHYVVVYQSEARIELWTRAADGDWPSAPDIIAGIAASLPLAAFDLAIPMAAIYADTELAAATGT